MKPSQIYRPLDPQSQQIRLLRIFPSSELEAPIYCSIFEADLKDDPPPIYRALSYAWGDPKLTAEINIEGNEAPTTIGPNLSLAIRYIRHDSDDVVLWADALCINQNDIQERSDQVRMMGSVYDGAKEVIAWLGEEDDDTKIAMELVQSWATFMDMSNSFEGIEHQPMGAAALERIQRLVPMALDSRANSALLALAQKPYWVRAWVYQELSLANNVVIQCGRVSKTLDCFLTAHQGLQMLYVLTMLGHTPTDFVAIGRIMSRRMAHMFDLVGRSRGMRPYSLKTLPLSMLKSFKGLDSTDPRDKVFALLGFVALDGPYPELITPDYEKSIEQVYLDVAKYLILTERTLHVLNQRHLPLSTSRHRSMPTWVPDWQVDTKIKTISHRIHSEDERALIGNNLVSQLVRFLPGGELCVKGFEVDVVSEVFNSGLFPFWDAPEGSNPIIEFKNFSNHLWGGPLVKTETALSAYFRLAIYNRLKDSEEPDPQNQRFFKSAAQFLRYIFQKIETGDCFPPGSPTANIIQIWPYLLVGGFLGKNAAQSERERLLDMVLHEDLDLGFYTAKVNTINYGNLLFRTEGGSLGLGPEGMARGDALCHLAVHPNPFLLRPAGPRYTNVGDCDVLDLNLPEVVEELIPSMRDFEIE